MRDLTLEASLATHVSTRYGCSMRMLARRYTVHFSAWMSASSDMGEYLRQHVFTLLGSLDDPLDVLWNDVLIRPQVHQLISAQQIHHARIVRGQVQDAIRERPYHLPNITLLRRRTSCGERPSAPAQRRHITHRASDGHLRPPHVARPALTAASRLDICTHLADHKRRAEELRDVLVALVRLEQNGCLGAALWNVLVLQLLRVR
jgi:hypothetical protein